MGSIRKKQIDPATKLEDYGKALKAGEADAKEFRLPADHAWFPAGRRYLQSIVDAQMTSIDGTSHLFAFGEFAAMYLSVWSNAVWTPLRDPREPELLDLPTMEEVFERAKWPNIISTFVGTPLNVEETRDTLLQGETSEIKKKNKELKLSPFRDEGYVGYERKDNGKYTDDKGKPQTAQEHFAKKLDERKTDLRKERRRLTLFHDGLAKVRRVLANIPTYMMFDDHDFTDDWNLNPMWYDRVYTTDLGVTSARNALASYAVFQDWGNDPIRYEKQDDYKELLARIVQLFPTGEPGPVAEAANRLDALFGFKEQVVSDPVTGRFPARNPVIKWHYSVPGPKHLAVAIDNRTRRSFPSRLGPPGNVEGSFDPNAVTAQTEQIPAGPFTDGKEVLLVIAPLQVLGRRCSMNWSRRRRSASST